MKKWIIVVILLVVIILGASFMIKAQNDSQAKENATEAQEITENGITLTIPGNWVVADSSSNQSLLAVADPSSKDASGFSNVNVNIEKQETSNSLNYVFNANYNTLARNTQYDVLYVGNVTVNGVVGMGAGYLTNDSSIVKQHKAVWFQDGSNIYVILCTAPQSQFATVEPTFNYIINSIKI